MKRVMICLSFFLVAIWIPVCQAQDSFLFHTIDSVVATPNLAEEGSKSGATLMAPATLSTLNLTGNLTVLVVSVGFPDKSVRLQSQVDKSAVLLRDGF